MDISSVSDACELYKVILSDGIILWVPKDALNADYARVQKWIADGGVVT